MVRILKNKIVIEFETPNPVCDLANMRDGLIEVIGRAASSENDETDNSCYHYATQLVKNMQLDENQLKKIVENDE